MSLPVRNLFSKAIMRMGRMSDLIIGSQGLLGSALSRHLPNAIQGVVMEAKTKKQRYIDITKQETIKKAFAICKPKTVYLAGAITDVDACEESTGTSVVNVRGATNVLRACEKYGSKLVFFSTSYVFDGTKGSAYTIDDTPNPIQKYGQQKLVMEGLISASEAEYVIIRTVSIFGVERRKRNFAKQILSLVFSGMTAIVPSDQYVNPIHADDLAKASVALGNSSAIGIHHVAGDTCLSKYEFAKIIAGHFGYADSVKPFTEKEHKQVAPRPKMGCLECTVPAPSLDNGIQKFLASEFYG